MKNIKIGLWGILAIISGLWLLANLPFPDAPGVFGVRKLLVQFSGVIALGAMSVAMILATRAKWVEPWLKGLDKSYRLHKWLGITALSVAIAHWLAVNAPKWLVDLGLLERPNRGPRSGNGAELGGLHSFLNGQRDTAEMIGEWAFYAIVLLIALALIKRFPYKYFASTHTLIAVAYLTLVYHGVVLMDFDAWLQPVGLVTAALMAGGVISAVLVLSRQVGRSKTVSGTIENVRTFSKMGVTEALITLDEGWAGHEGGQFAFVTFERREGKHPFTIASAWDAATRKVMFITKGLGDYTALLPERIHPGDAVRVEGPYGCFTFDDNKKRQIWIGGGIGITPFIARMQQLAQGHGGQQIDLIHSVNEIEPEALELLKADAKAANVTLHVMLPDRDGFLNGDRLRAMIPDWKAASVWFCGPAGFGQAIRKDMMAHGLSGDAFHQELFNLR
ncbi:MAG: ferric reductase-like transmembrane domain-containing protein [Pseudodonghicola sp.]|nr:ferric reductase-like transmembrane domain-containing protein [Pseudodonghicola sp.]